VELTELFRITLLQDYYQVLKLTF